MHVDWLGKHSLYFKIVLPTPHLALCSYKLSFHQSLASFYSNRRGNRNIFFTFSFIYNFQSDIQELPQNNDTDRSFNCRPWWNELFALLYYQRSVNSTQSTYFGKASREYEVQFINYYCNVVMHLLIKQFCFKFVNWFETHLFVLLLSLFYIS